jgi:hypothetical protein
VQSSAPLAASQRAKPQAEANVAGVLAVPRPIVIAYHLIWTGYGWWLPNDPRGSMSHRIASDVIAELGELHYGRKKVQPRFLTPYDGWPMHPGHCPNSPYARRLRGEE